MITNRYDAVSYRNAETTAKEATDAELIDWMRILREQDRSALNMGGRGMIDDPHWGATLAELHRRGLETPGR